MITGDGKETAAAIAEMLGLQTDRKVLLSGAEVDRMNDVELQRIADSVSLNSYIQGPRTRGGLGGSDPPWNCRFIE